MYNLQDWAAVQSLHDRGYPIRAIARELGMSRNTVRKLLKETEEPHYHRTVYRSVIDEYKETIYEWVEKYGFNGTRIYRELKERGYTGSIGPVYRLLKVINEDVGWKISSKATVRIETPPGDQAQFDWSPYEMEIYGRVQTVNCFSLILACSRKKAICFSLNADAGSIYEAIQELFDDLGGVTQELLIDNPKALVIENNPKSEDEVRYNPQALLMAKHLGTELNACPCYWPRKKGKVENPFKYIFEQFVKGRSFATMEELNAAGKRFVEEWNNEVHTTTKRIPNEHYRQEENGTLLPLPKSHFFVSKAEPRKVSNDSLVSVRGSKYSVPVKYATKNVSFRMVYGFRILIYDSHGEQILSVEKAAEKGTTVSNSEHYAAIAKKTSTSIPQIRRDFTATFKNGRKYLDAAGHKFEQPTHHARRILELQDLYDTELLDYFIGLSVTEDCMDITHFKALLKEKSADALKHLGSGRSTPADESEGPEAGAPDDGLVRDTKYYDSIEYREAANG